MRTDMSKVVTEAPRYGHSNPSKKWGRRLSKDEYDADDHGPTRAPIAARRQYGWNAKEFSDVIGPLRRYLRKQVGRPWDKVWSEISRTLDTRSLTGRHIMNHVRWEVERGAFLGDNGRLYRTGRYGAESVTGLYVHPVTGIVGYKPRPSRVRGGPFVLAKAALGRFGLHPETCDEIRRFRVDGLRLWERRDRGWFIHEYRVVPERLVRVVTHGGGREVRIYEGEHCERVGTKQASKIEMREAMRLLEHDPLA